MSLSIFMAASMHMKDVVTQVMLLDILTLVHPLCVRALAITPHFLQLVGCAT